MTAQPPADTGAAAASMDERIAQRRAEVRHARRRVLLRRGLVVLALVLAGVAAWAINRSSVVALLEVRVEGTRRLDAAAVRDAADLELGASMLSLPLEEARRRVEGLPLVDTATVELVEPVVVALTVVEREPAVRVVASGGSRIVDARGVVLGEPCQPCGDQDLLPIRLTGRPPGVGDVAAPTTPLGNAVLVVAGLDPDLEDEVETVRAPADLDGLTLVLRDGLVVRVGRAERLAEKLRSLTAVRDDLGDREVGAIDVRAPLAPVVTDR